MFGLRQKAAFFGVRGEWYGEPMPRACATPCKYKYHSCICQINACPDGDHSAGAGRFYRFVFANLAHPHNFIPVLAKPTPPALPPHKVCSGWALSVFEDEQQARDFYIWLRKNSKNLDKKLGGHIATVAVVPTDGELGPADGKTHRDLHEYDGCNLLPTAIMIGPI